MAEIIVHVPQGADAEKVKRRIEAILDLVVSDEFDRFMEFLEDETDIYTGKDIIK